MDHCIEKLDCKGVDGSPCPSKIHLAKGRSLAWQTGLGTTVESGEIRSHATRSAPKPPTLEIREHPRACVH